MIDVTCAIILRNQKILVAQNKQNADQAGKWEFPGGKIKPNETPGQCIIREIREELELSVSIIHELREVVYNYRHKAIRLIPFVCKIEKGTIQLNDHQDVKWLRIGDLKELDLAMADKALLEIQANLDLLEKYLGE